MKKHIFVCFGVSGLVLFLYILGRKNLVVVTEIGLTVVTTLHRVFSGESGRTRRLEYRSVLRAPTLNSLLVFVLTIVNLRSLTSEDRN